MSLMNQIKQDQLQARKAREIKKASLLTTLIGEASIIGKNDGNRETTDEEVIRVIKKFIKGLQEVKQHSNDTAAFCECDVEIEILESYLPKMLTTEELEVIIKTMVEGAGGEATMGSIMGALKSVYPGLYDGKVASGIVKEMLK